MICKRDDADCIQCEYSKTKQNSQFDDPIVCGCTLNQENQEENDPYFSHYEEGTDADFDRYAVDVMNGDGY